MLRTTTWFLFSRRSNSRPPRQMRRESHKSRFYVVSLREQWIVRVKSGEIPQKSRSECAACRYHSVLDRIDWVVAYRLCYIGLQTSLLPNTAQSAAASDSVLFDCCPGWRRFSLVLLFRLVVHYWLCCVVFRVTGQVLWSSRRGQDVPSARATPFSDGKWLFRVDAAPTSGGGALPVSLWLAITLNANWGPLPINFWRITRH